MSVPIRVIIADDHTLLRRGLQLMLDREPDLTVVAEASDGRSAVELCEQHSPDVIVMDIAMPNLNGIEAASRIASSRPKTAVIVLSMHSDEAYVLRALRAGAKGYLLKDSAENDLITAVKRVAGGKTFFSPAISNMLMEDYVRSIRERGVDDSYELLTSRERELLQLIAEGKTSKEVAAGLGVSASTIDTHRANLMRKLNVGSVAELVLYAVRKGIIS